MQQIISPNIITIQIARKFFIHHHLEIQQNLQKRMSLEITCNRKKAYTLVKLQNIFCLLYILFVEKEKNKQIHSYALIIRFGNSLNQIFMVSKGTIELFIQVRIICHHDSIYIYGH